MLQPVSDSRRWLIGLDDTDSLDTRGTGYRARRLVAALEAARLADAIGVTRHQLLVDERIPYTSHNSSACIEICSSAAAPDLFAFCREFMLAEAAAEADVGLCLGMPAQGAAVASYGRRAKRDVLDQDVAGEAAAKAGVTLEGLTGTRDGIIGALAGIGLFADGNDGRYIWKPALRELANDIVKVAELLSATGIDDIRLLDGEGITDQSGARVALGPWPRPVRIDGLCVLLVEEGKDHECAEYHCIEKHRVKAFRP